MTYYIDIQHASNSNNPIEDHMIMHWAKAALQSEHSSAELTIRFVDPEEMQSLNHRYRQQDKTTNVLAFPSDIPPAIQLDCPFLGDVVICPDVLHTESIDLEKPLQAHWAHIIVHGILHLLGYDHIQEADATEMEACEVTLLAQLGFDNPYQKDLHLE